MSGGEGGGSLRIGESDKHGLTWDSTYDVISNLKPQFQTGGI